MHWPARIIEACGLFAGTNIDDLVVLVAWNAEGIPFHRILVGQWLGIGGLLAASLLLGQGAGHLPPIGVRLLGVVPLLLGSYKALEAWRGWAADEEPKAGGGGVLSIAAVTVANGGDNVAAYVPSLATGNDGLAVYVAVFACMTFLWCVASRALVRHPVVRAGVERAGSWLTPAVLVAVGVLVLLG